MPRVADGILYTLIALVVVLAVIAAWRVLVHDRSIRRIRFGVFYERERNHDEHDFEEEPPQERLPS